MKKHLFVLFAVLLALTCVFAACQSKVYNITFDAQNGSQHIVVAFDESYQRPADPTNGEMVFGGWYTDAACSEGKEFVEPAELTSDITVYAKWSEPVIYTVTFDPQNGEDEVEIPFDADFAIPTYFLNGQKALSGWYTDAAGSPDKAWSKPASLNADVKVYAKWVNTVSFDVQNGSERIVVNFDEHFAAPSNLQNGTQKLLGWYTDSACTKGNEWTAPESLSSNIVVYAKWANIVSFDAQNGSAVAEVPFDAEFAVVADPEKANCLFDGWYTDAACSADKKWTVPTALEENITVYAKWIVIADLSSVFNQYKNAWNFEVEYSYFDLDDTDNATSALLSYADGSYSVTYGSGDDEQTSYVFVKNDVVSFYKCNELGYYNIYDDQSVEYIVFSEYSSFSSIVNLALLSQFDFTQVGENDYAPINITEVGNLMFLGSDDYTWTSLTITIIDDQIVEIVGEQKGKANFGTYDFIYSYSFDEYDTVELSVPANVVEEHAKHNYGSYFVYDYCLVEGCAVIGRQESQNTYENELTFVFSEQTKTNVNASYQAVLDKLALASPEDSDEVYAAFEAAFEQFDSDLSDVIGQYLLAHMIYCAHYDSEDSVYEDNFNLVSEYRDELIGKYYRLFGAISLSPYDSRFFENWSVSEKQKVIALSNEYQEEGDYYDIMSQIDAIQETYSDLFEAYYDENDDDDAAVLLASIATEYSKLVDLNNDLARLAGKSDYMQYVHEVIEQREYSRADLNNLRTYVKQYILPAFEEVMGWYYAFLREYLYPSYNLFTETDTYLYETTVEGTIFGDTKQARFANGLVEDYLSAISDVNDAFDALQIVEDLFKNGNYFTGTRNASFTYNLPGLVPAVYFGANPTSSSNYQNPVAVVNELSYYINSVYNSRYSFPDELEDLQAAGAEMVLTCLMMGYNQVAPYGYQFVLFENNVNNMFSLLLAVAVDEFECAVYSGSYNGAPINGDYTALFSTIVDSYSDYLDSEYYGDRWAYVVFDQACKFIPTAVSNISALELFVDMYDATTNEEFNAAIANYVSLYTFTSAEAEDLDSNSDSNISYVEILEYCGFSNPFEEDLYKKLNASYIGNFQ